MPDDRWRPQVHALCRVEPNEDKLSPPGTWQVLAHGPDTPTSWWLMPISSDAHAWTTEHPNEVTSRCVQLPGNRLRSNHQHELHQGQPR